MKTKRVLAAALMFGCLVNLTAQSRTMVRPPMECNCGDETGPGTPGGGGGGVPYPWWCHLPGVYCYTPPQSPTPPLPYTPCDLDDPNGCGILDDAQRPVMPSLVCSETSCVVLN